MDQFNASIVSAPISLKVGMDSKSSFTATGLTSGTKYWFRVAAVGSGTGNQSPWSDPALKMAP